MKSKNSSFIKLIQTLSIVFVLMIGLFLKVNNNTIYNRANTELKLLKVQLEEIKLEREVLNQTLSSLTLEADLVKAASKELGMIKNPGAFDTLQRKHNVPENNYSLSTLLGWQIFQ